MKNFALSIRFAWETENFYFCYIPLLNFIKNHEGNPDTPAYHHFSDPPPLHNHTFYPSRDSIESCQSGTADKNVDVHKDICVHRSILCQLLLHNRAVIRQAATFPAFFRLQFPSDHSSLGLYISSGASKAILEGALLSETIHRRPKACILQNQSACSRAT